MGDENLLLALDLFTEDYRRKAAMLTKLEDLLRELMDLSLKRKKQRVSVSEQCRIALVIYEALVKWLAVGG